MSKHVFIVSQFYKITNLCTGEDHGAFLTPQRKKCQHTKLAEQATEDRFHTTGGEDDFAFSSSSEGEQTSVTKCPKIRPTPNELKKDPRNHWMDLNIVRAD